MIGFGIYLIGVIVTFIATRARLRYEAKKALRRYSWDDVAYTLFASLCSWVGLIPMIIMFLFILIVNIKDKIEMSNEPPKWL
jgi:hypothetical protein